MHFFIDKNQLIDAIQHVNKAVSTKTTIPILTGIKFDLASDGLVLTGSDSDISIQVFVPITKNDQEIVKVIKPGKIVLPAKYIVDIVKKLPGSEIEFSLVDTFSVLIRSASTEFKLNGYDPEEYPELPQIEEDQVLTINSDLLKSMIRQTIFAVSTLENRPILTGVLWKLNQGKLSFVSTDSHRLSMREANVEENGLTFDNVVVPGKTLQELTKILEDDSIPVHIVVTDNQILVKMENVLFYSRLLDGTYPDISRIIPEKGKTVMTVTKQSLLDAIERAALIAKNDKTNIVKLSILEELLLEITSNSPEVGKVTEHIKVNQLDGEALKISFNAKYTLEALKAMDSQEIKIEFTGALSPFVLKPTDHDRILHLILPVRTF